MLKVQYNWLTCYSITLYYKFSYPWKNMLALSILWYLLLHPLSVLRNLLLPGLSFQRSSLSLACLYKIIQWRGFSLYDVFLGWFSLWKMFSVSKANTTDIQKKKKKEKTTLDTQFSCWTECTEDRKPEPDSQALIVPNHTSHQLSNQKRKTSHF